MFGNLEHSVSVWHRVWAMGNWSRGRIGLVLGLFQVLVISLLGHTHR